MATPRPERFRPRWYMADTTKHDGPMGRVQVESLVRDRRRPLTLPEELLRLAQDEYDLQFPGQPYERMQERGGPRLFESNIALLVPARPPRQADPVAVYGKNDGRRLWTRKDGSELRCASLEEAREAMGIDWMTWDEIREAVPPAYTEHIGRQLIDALEVAA